MPVRNLAVGLTTKGFWNGRGLRQKDFAGEAKRINDYVRDEIRYVGDINGVELVHDPVTLLEIGAGDCDDKATLLASLLLAIGHQPRFVAVSLDGREFCHVWVQDAIDGRWLDLETTEPLPFGASVDTSQVRKAITQDI